MTSIAAWWLAGFLTLYGPPASYPPVTRIAETAYKTVGEESLQLDMFLPESAEAAPAVILINGGSWRYNDRRDYYDFARGLARSGIAGVTPGFRPTPPLGFADQVEDIKDAIRWVRANAAEYNIDPERIGIYGSSSGGHLAALAGTAFNGEGLGDDPPGTSSELQAAFYLFGIYDLETSPITAINRIASPEAPFGIPNDQLYRFSPVHYVDGNEPPTYFLHGGKDLLVPPAEVEGMQQAMEAAGVDARLQLVPHLGHGFIKMRPWLRPAIFQLVRTYFAETLRRDTSGSPK